jgi:hypothetical protein
MDPAVRLNLEIQLREARRSEIEDRTKAHNLSVQRTATGSERRSLRSAAPRAAASDFLAIAHERTNESYSRKHQRKNKNKSIFGLQRTAASKLTAIKHVQSRP